MIFVGSKVFAHARYWQIKKYVCMIFFCGGGGHLGGTDNLWGGHVPPPPQAPRSYAPADIPILSVSKARDLGVIVQDDLGMKTHINNMCKSAGRGTTQDWKD